MKAQFITFEGGEGTGKTTQVIKVLERLPIPCFATREPGGTSLGEGIRSLFLSHTMNPLCELLCVLAARLHHVETVILPKLTKGTWVFCDRFCDSSLVYQGIIKGLSLEDIHHWHRMAGITLKPALTFLFQDPPDITLQRRQQRKEKANRFDAASYEIHEKIFHAYNFVAEQEPDRFVKIPLGKTISQVTDFILETLNHHFSVHFTPPSKE